MNPLRKLTSALSTAHALVLSAIELPDALRDISSGLEWRKWAREFTEVDCVDDETVRNAVGKLLIYTRAALIAQTEIYVERGNQIKVLKAERDCLRTSLSISRDSRASAVSEYEKAIEMVKLTGAVYDEAVKERDTLRAKLDDLERWRQVTSGEGELPPEGVDVIYRYDDRPRLFLGAPSDDRTYQWRFASSDDAAETTRNNGQAL